MKVSLRFFLKDDTIMALFVFKRNVQRTKHIHLMKRPQMKRCEDAKPQEML